MEGKRVHACLQEEVGGGGKKVGAFHLHSFLFSNLQLFTSADAYLHTHKTCVTFLHGKPPQLHHPHTYSKWPQRCRLWERIVIRQHRVCQTRPRLLNPPALISLSILAPSSISNISTSTRAGEEEGEKKNKEAEEEEKEEAEEEKRRAREGKWRLPCLAEARRWK